MPRCAACGNDILFGGKRLDYLNYCDDECLARGRAARSAFLSPEEFEEAVRQVHEGPCPRCRRRGPVGFHHSHYVWSALAFTRYGKRSRLLCGSCGFKLQLNDALFSLIFGWWGFPWGFIMTPIHVARNVAKIIKPLDLSHPNQELEDFVRRGLDTGELAYLRGSDSH